jgi:large subunit ribosomal protein L21
MSYAIITLGGKQYRVEPGERLLVDRLGTDTGKTFQPSVLMVGGDGEVDLSPKTTVTARVVEHVRGDKIRIGKYRPKNGYRKHTGFRAALTRIEIESIGSAKAKVEKKAEPKHAPKAEAPKAEKAPAAKAEKAPEAKAEEAPKPTRTAHPPKGYEDLTVAQIHDEAPHWRRPNLEAALEYERENANRKGAIAALEAALEAKEHHD